MTLLKAFDLLVVVSGSMFAFAMTSREFERDNWLSIFQLRLSLANLLGVFLYIAAWHVALTTRGLYNSYRLSRPMREVGDLAVVVLLCVGPLALLRSFLDIDVLTPSFINFFGVTSFLGLCLERRLLRGIARHARAMGRNLRDVVFVGAGRQNLEAAADLARRDAGVAARHVEAEGADLWLAGGGGRHRAGGGVRRHRHPPVRAGADKPVRQRHQVQP